MALFNLIPTSCQRFGRHFKNCQGTLEAAEAEAEPMEEDDSRDESDTEDEETRSAATTLKFSYT